MDYKMILINNIKKLDSSVNEDDLKKFSKQKLENIYRNLKNKGSREKSLFLIDTDRTGNQVYKDESGNLWKKINDKLYSINDIEDQIGLPMRSDIICRYI